MPLRHLEVQNLDSEVAICPVALMAALQVWKQRVPPETKLHMTHLAVRMVKALMPKTSRVMSAAKAAGTATVWETQCIHKGKSSFEWGPVCFPPLILDPTGLVAQVRE